MVGILVSFWDGPFLGAKMLVSGSVNMLFSSTKGVGEIRTDDGLIFRIMPPRAWPGHT